MRTGWFGRFLCRRGLHKWEHGSMVDRLDDDTDDNYREFKVTDWQWCRRPDCDEGTHKVNVEVRKLTLR